MLTEKEYRPAIHIDNFRLILFTDNFDNKVKHIAGFFLGITATRTDVNVQSGIVWYVKVQGSFNEMICIKSKCCFIHIVYAAK